MEKIMTKKYQKYLGPQKDRLIQRPPTVGVLHVTAVQRQD